MNNMAANKAASLFTKLIRYRSCVSVKSKNWPTLTLLDARLNTNQFEIIKIEVIKNA